VSLRQVTRSLPSPGCFVLKYEKCRGLSLRLWRRGWPRPEKSFSVGQDGPESTAMPTVVWIMSSSEDWGSGPEYTAVCLVALWELRCEPKLDDTDRGVLLFSKCKCREALVCDPYIWVKRSCRAFDTLSGQQEGEYAARWLIWARGRVVECACLVSRLLSPRRRSQRLTR